MMTDLFGLILPITSGIAFLYWSWRQILYFNENYLFSRFTFYIRGSIGTWPFLQFVMWIFIKDSVLREIAIAITLLCNTVQFISLILV